MDLDAYDLGAEASSNQKHLWQCYLPRLTFFSKSNTTMPHVNLVIVVNDIYNCGFKLSFFLSQVFLRSFFDVTFWDCQVENDDLLYTA